MSEDSRKETAKSWHPAIVRRSILVEDSNTEEVKQKAEFTKATLTVTLDRHATSLRVIARSKR